MKLEDVSKILSDWKIELSASLLNSRSFCIGLFNIKGRLLMANEAFSVLLKENSKKGLINPTFDKLVTLNYSNSLIFEGAMTLGDSNTINASIEAKVFRKNNKLLILGGINVSQLLAQNESMHLLNREIINLQRQLIKEKLLLENTLKELNSTNSELQELNATKDKFFSIIAHDLRSPFSSIVAISELLAANAANYSLEKIQMIANNMHRETKNTFSLLDNLLEWSRLQTGKLIPSIVEMDYKHTVLDVISLTKPIALSKNIALELDLDTPVPIKADQQMLSSILRNLITNALKFTHPEGNVKITSKNTKKEVLFAVTDSGIGIETKYLKNLFSIDCELSNKGTANEKGTGLGLLLCKEFVEKQNGKIWAESSFGKGSSFKFSLPRF